jgi:hypothetical protein
VELLLEPRHGAAELHQLALALLHELELPAHAVHLVRVRVRVRVRVKVRARARARARARVRAHRRPAAVAAPRHAEHLNRLCRALLRRDVADLDLERRGCRRGRADVQPRRVERLAQRRGAARQEAVRALPPSVEPLLAREPRELPRVLPPQRDALEQHGQARVARGLYLEARDLAEAQQRRWSGEV